MATIKEVSDLAGVSQATVSRVMNGNNKVSEINRERVMAAMDKLGYQPNSFAQALATNRSYSVGIVVGTLSGPFYGPMMHSIESVLRNEGQHLIATSGHDDLEQERDAIRFLNSRRVDAILLVVQAMGDDELIEMCQRNPNIFVLNRYVPELANRCIYLNNELGGYLATKHLIDLGHTKIASITGPLVHLDARERLQGYRNALNEAGIEYDAQLVVEGLYQEDGGNKAAAKLFQRDVEFTGVVCGNDNIAIGVYDILSLDNESPAERISVVGYDDMFYSRYLRPKMTTIRFPIEEMGTIAANMVLQNLSNVDLVKGVQLEPQLIVRESSAPPVG
ncbi:MULTISPECIES: LacI family DNA-binding transcriptional regulator [unclassified Agarivorans]|uniref:LacI family DNA-binding transcriptional regulator n=1 Tax=unclassified Agarivorans TaxID=2636026 RepID=UPI0010E562E1|nr:MULTISPECIES: LacI family DNA-binding transcriptional regulator [unclassified Agarivorans]MDO6685450.1 LacI family DNA-binding transcriptional regulator [Agarivorans sp. 3_MG-2023]MDO6715836.1 LacI family DNA-binding transcriptional regulator [Agarivorans sp. 2_MG-2023]MDO6764878.1 LacI family DNA-binding transcriptional regulator [Agarivorans sp. 1_MG-2023]GDY25257.1 transcriptional regulator [Agarivorans sp. Toyoura001]